MQFNEFQRRLHHCHIDEETKYLLSHMFEVQVEVSKHLDIATNLLGQLMDKVNQVLQMDHHTQQQMAELQRRGMDAEVHSVRNEPE